MNEPRDNYNCGNRGIDYYAVLSVQRECTDLELKAAFRRLAVRYNPYRKNNEGNSAVFSLVVEAYDVLSDSLRRAVYDQYGEHGLKEGVDGPEGYIEPYVFHQDPMRIYKEFFGTNSAYPDLLDGAAKSAESRIASRKAKPIIKPLVLTLSETFFGGIKKMRIEKFALALDDRSRTILTEIIITVPVQPGTPSGTKIIFPGEGDENPSKFPGDVIFVTEDRPHETFRRVGCDLHMTVDIFLREALTGTVVTVNTVDDRTLRIPITSIVTPDYKKVVFGEGLPVSDDLDRKGNLVIGFNVEFPVYLSVRGKYYAKKAFEWPSTDRTAEDTEDIRGTSLAEKMRRNIDYNVPLRREPAHSETEKFKVLCNASSEFTK